MYRILPVIHAWVIQIVVSVGDVNILGKNINAIKKNMDILISTTIDIGLDMNTEKLSAFMSCHQNVEKYKYS